MARLIHIFALMLALVSAGAQTSRGGETVFVSTNSTAFLAGETVYFSIICLNPENKIPDAISKIGYVELVDSSHSAVIRRKVAIENNSGNGDIFLPANLRSGNYKLIGYTRLMLETSAQHFYSVDLTIVNPFEKFEGEILDNGLAEQSDENRPILAQSDKKTYTTREKVRLNFNQSELKDATFTVSVKKKSAFSNPNSTPAQDVPMKNFPSSAIAEVRGEIITGKITGKNPKKLGNKNIALSMPGKTFDFKIVQTDADGKFAFVVSPSQARNAIIQVMEPDREEYSISIDQHKTPDYSQLQFEKFTVDRNTKDAIAQRTVALQIENAYFERKKDSIRQMETLLPFYHTLEKTYVLDDYARFPTLRETIIEVVKEMYFTKRRDQYEIHLRNTSMDNEKFGQPLILVDGLLVQDHTELFSYGANGIEKVDLIIDPYVYGPKTFSGVANFTTKLQDFKSRTNGDYIKHVSLERVQPSKVYFQPDYSTPARVPDYRHQLLWHQQSGRGEVEFSTSDVTGEFEIIVEGFTNSGKQIYSLATFTVK